jgi:hypothetical protein
MAQQQTVLSSTETYDGRTRKTHYVLQLGCGCEKIILKAKGVEKPPTRKTCYKHTQHVDPGAAGGEHRSDFSHQAGTDRPATPSVPTTQEMNSTSPPAIAPSAETSAGATNPSAHPCTAPKTEPDYSEILDVIAKEAEKIDNEPYQKHLRETFFAREAAASCRLDGDTICIPPLEITVPAESPDGPPSFYESPKNPVMDEAISSAPQPSESVIASAPTDPTEYTPEGRMILDTKVINRTFDRMYPSSKPLK